MSKAAFLTLKGYLLFISNTLKVIISLMEKGKPHYLLSNIKALVAREGEHAFTFTARQDVWAMNLTMKDAADIIATLDHAMFYKSMTTHTNHRIWQDVYHGYCPNGKTAYIKFTLNEERQEIVIQFKEK
jgi:motility quorum-sensing regulator/GCU-specific mRNA interferase toxin